MASALKILTLLHLLTLAWCVATAADKAADKDEEHKDIDSDQPEDDLETEETGWLLAQKMQTLEGLKNLLISPLSGFKSSFPSYGGGYPTYSSSGGGAFFGGSAPYYTNSRGNFPYKSQYNFYPSFTPVKKFNPSYTSSWNNRGFSGGVYQSRPTSVYAPNCNYPTAFRPSPSYTPSTPTYSSGTPLNYYYNTAPIQTYGVPNFSTKSFFSSGPSQVALQPASFQPSLPDVSSNAYIVKSSSSYQSSFDSPQTPGPSPSWSSIASSLPSFAPSWSGFSGSYSPLPSVPPPPPAPAPVVSTPSPPSWSSISINFPSSPAPPPVSSTPLPPSWSPLSYSSAPLPPPPPPPPASPTWTYVKASFPSTPAPPPVPSTPSPPPVPSIPGALPPSPVIPVSPSWSSASASFPSTPAPPAVPSTPSPPSWPSIAGSLPSTPSPVPQYYVLPSSTPPPPSDQDDVIPSQEVVITPPSSSAKGNFVTTLPGPKVDIPQDSLQYNSGPLYAISYYPNVFFISNEQSDKSPPSDTSSQSIDQGALIQSSDFSSKTSSASSDTSGVSNQGQPPPQGLMQPVLSSFYSFNTIDQTKAPIASSFQQPIVPPGSGSFYSYPVAPNAYPISWGYRASPLSTPQQQVLTLPSLKTSTSLNSYPVTGYTYGSPSTGVQLGVQTAKTVPGC